MGWAYQAMITMATVALLLGVAQWFGKRTAGLLAGLPTVTGPALVWLAWEFGADFAAQAAAGSVAACAFCAVFALGYERASRRAGPILALLAADACAAVVAAPTLALQGELEVTMIVAMGSCLMVLALLPTGARDRRMGCRLPAELWVTAGAAALVTAAAAIAGPHVGAFWTGVLASPPLVAAAIAVNLHVVHGQAATSPFLRGYVAGLLGRTLFGAIFCVLVVSMGIAVSALFAAIAGCALTMLLTYALNVPDARRVPKALRNDAAKS